LEVWEEAFSAYQDPLNLIEPALGGPDTTERVRLGYTFKLLRLAADEDCGNIADRLRDDFAAKGHLTVTPAPTVVINGDCPVQAGGGYTGFEHYLYRIEVAAPNTAGAARFKWSRFNGGLVGRGVYNNVTDEITVRDNTQMINYCGLTDFYLEVLAAGPATDPGRWQVVMSADATLIADSRLSLANISGNWPGLTTDEAFFRLWDGVRLITAFPVGLPNPNELEQGIQLGFDPPAADNGNYTPGDFWTFPVRAAGVEFDPSIWPANAPPQGIHYHRAPLAVLNWNGGPVVHLTGTPAIHDCRHVFPPLTQIQTCCTFTVGDGVHSRGDFSSIADALVHLPAQGGQICVLPGIHQANVSVTERRDIRISGCGKRSIVHPHANQASQPIFRFTSCRGIELDNLALVATAGTAVEVRDSAQSSQSSKDIRIHDNYITACVHAIDIRVDNERRGANDIHVARNTIGMLDKAEGRAAIFSLADDVVIIDNRIVVVPAPDRDNPDDPRDPDDPSVGVFDPCAEPQMAFASRFILVSFLEATFVYVMTSMAQPRVIYQAQGGIQIGGSSEHIMISRNTILGGRSNGITLGHLPAGLNVAGFGGGVLLAPLSAEQLQLLRDEFVGVLYDLTIAENTIQHMGLSGIGVVAFFQTTITGLLVRVEALIIYRNTIVHCARQMPLEIPSTLRDDSGFGGIALSACEDATIQENRIEDNGVRHIDPVCGIFLRFGEKVDISNNRILNNGPQVAALEDDLRPGTRGGVVIKLSFTQVGAVLFGQDETLLAPDGIPAVKIHDNIITQPVGQSLFIIAFGPVSVLGNHLTTQGTDFRTNVFALLAGAVFILNLGISKDLIGAVARSSFRNMANANVSQLNVNGMTKTRLKNPQAVTLLERLLYLPSGSVLYSNNQTTLDLRHREMNFSFSAQLIASLDDISYSNNQSECTSLFDVVMTNVALLGVSVRANDNRLQEGFTLALYSLFSYGLMNAATTNQATHCLQVLGSPTYLVNAGNRVLYSAGCDDDRQLLAVAVQEPL
jgi:hypothetical protein